MMLRGCQKQMIVLQTQESSLFESAFFVLRREGGTVAADDMLAEANRIIGLGVTAKRRRGRGWERALYFSLGVFVSAGIFALIFLLRVC